MKQCHPSPTPDWSPLPALLLSRLAAFSDLFTRPTWANALLLLTGTILAPGRRVVTAALRILGLDQNSNFPTFHAVLSQARWSSRAVAGRLLRMLVAAFVPRGARVVIGLDDTIERRWGKMIKARGIYRDPVRSSKGFFVKTSGLRWLSAMLLVDVPWAGRLLALPFLTVLAPSKRFYEELPRSYKTLLDWARQMVLQIRRWLPDHQIVVVADSAFAAIEFLAAVRTHVTVVTRLRLDAALFTFPQPKPKGRGRPAVKGTRMPRLAQILHDPATLWQRHTVPLWYGQTNRTLEIATGIALWYHSGLPPVPIRWILVREPKGMSNNAKDRLEPQAFLCTDLQADPIEIVGWFINRWQVEVTFQETRAHLGVETQRQWSDLAILRTTPALLGLFSLITLWMHDITQWRTIAPKTAAWYPKASLTFSDAIAAVRREIWNHQIFCMSRSQADTIKIPHQAWERIANAISYAR
jgi:hypothetical protein